ncbi:MAG TPA: branched-chain amino acid transport system II carrier protein [Myxococcota bacterium]|nr:branched-chain amino acid transport system II carrier protein [Myxococcota bacterium]
MAQHKYPSPLVVGLALFSMFFGSGNLIFPLMLGAKYEGYFYICALGFTITAVLLPTLGIMAMLPAQGHYEKLFEQLLPKRISRWFFFIALVAWIPLGSGPRCVLLAYASIKTYIPTLPHIWIFSLFFLAIVYFSLINRHRVIDFLGKILTPILLITIFAMIISSLITGGSLEIPEESPGKIFLNSLVDGYYTQDLIAAIFFSSALVTMIYKNTGSMRTALQKTWQGGLIAVALLALLYGALMASSAIHGEELAGLSGEQLVSKLAHITLGSTFGGISSVAVSLACLTTEIALVLVFADFLTEHLPHKHSRQACLLITLALIFLMSLLPFEGIMAVVAPAMQAIYPILFLLVLRTLWRARKSLAH